MKLRLFLLIVFLLVIVLLTNVVTNYAVYISGAQTYGMVKFCVRLIVICTGIIVFFVEKNGLQTRKKIEEEFDELHERLHKEKQVANGQESDEFVFVHPQEDESA